MSGPTDLPGNSDKTPESTQADQPARSRLLQSTFQFIHWPQSGSESSELRPLDIDSESSNSLVIPARGSGLCRPAAPTAQSDHTGFSSDCYELSPDDALLALHEIHKVPAAEIHLTIPHAKTTLPFITIPVSAEMIRTLTEGKTRRFRG